MEKNGSTNKSLKQQAYEKLSEMFLNDELKPGDPLIEIELSERLNVSRTPLREAFLQLQSEGIVEIIPRKGAFIRKISLHDIRELFQIREALEGMAANLAANRIATKVLDEIMRMFEAADRMDDPMERFSASEEAGTRLHQEIIKASENERIGDTLGHYQIILAKERNRAAQIEVRLGNAIKEHKVILEALKVGPAEAEKAMREHIRNTLKSVVERSQANGGF